MSTNKLSNKVELILDENDRASIIERAARSRPVVDFDPEETTDAELGRAESQRRAQSLQLFKRLLNSHKQANKLRKRQKTLNLVGKSLTATTVFFAAGYVLAGNPSVAMIILSAFAAGMFLKKA